MIYADMHCDTVLGLMQGKALLENDMHIDIAKLRKGGCMAQCFALFVNLKSYPRPEAYGRMLAMAERFREELQKNSEYIRQAQTAEEIRKNREEGLISAVLTVEEGGVIEGKLERLEVLRRLGVRFLTLTWNYENELGFPNLVFEKDGRPDFTRPNTAKGFKEKGREAIYIMEELGIIPDVSHFSDAGFYELLEISRKPFAATHSNARAVCGHIRNLTDDMIAKLADKGGVMGLNFCNGFLSEENKNGRIEDVVRHALHIKNVGGAEVLAFGSDFDGIPKHEELYDASQMTRLIYELKKAGFTEKELDLVCSGNFLRMLAQS